jgi:CAAX prenyl protease-like protein
LSLAIFARAAPFAAFILLLAVFPQWPLVRGAAAAVLLAVFWRQYRELGATWLTLRELALAVAVGLAIFLAWILLDHDWFTFGEPHDGFDPARGGAFDWPGTIGRFLVLAAVVPVMEELFWRSFLMRWIDARDFLARDARRTTRMALALASALFAMEHSLWLAGLIAGLAYGWLFIRTNNLWAPVAAHMVTNAILGVWIVATGSWHLW